MKQLLFFFCFAVINCLPVYARPECRVVVVDADGSNSIGSGCLIATDNDPDNVGCVLTAAHVVRNWDRRTPITLQWHDGPVTLGRVSAVDAVNDAAVIVTDPPDGADAALMGEDNPEAGSVATISGWQHGQRFSVSSGRVRWGSYADGSFSSPVLSVVGTSAISGQSGGPIWNKTGIVGVVSGSDGERTVGPPVGFVRRWLLNLGWRLRTGGGCSNGYCTPYTRPQPRPRNPGVRDIYDGPSSQPQPAPKPEPIQPKPEPCPNVDYDRIAADVLGKIPPGLTAEDVEKIVADSIADYRPELDPRQLATAIQPHLDPITIQIQDTNGSILDTDTQRLGGTFRFRLILKNP